MTGPGDLPGSGDLFVKICGITSEADALLAVGMGASAVGFVFAPSTRQMAPSAVADMPTTGRARGRLPALPKNEARPKVNTPPSDATSQ